ncbi:MAG TPA: GNAT family N-acetyltransferase [Acidobacteriota bacterium]
MNAAIVVIRDYCPQDLKGVLALVQELEAEMKEKFSDVSIKPGGPEYQNRYLKPGNKFKTFVALEEDKVVGYLMGWPVLGAPEVDNMYDVLPASKAWKPAEFYFHITFVSKPCRRRGISKKLHLAALKYAREKGYKEVYACIAKWNAQELSVIRALGFQEKDLGYRYRFSLKL